MPEVTFSGLFGFVFIMALGGGAAYIAGRATATTWRPVVTLGLYMLLLACALRFIHFAIGGLYLWSGFGYVLDLIACAIGATLGFVITRARRMATQYYWLYERDGPFRYRRRPGT